jgi:hypothetical protein
MILFCLTLLLSLPRVDSATVEGFSLQPPPAAGGNHVLVMNGRFTVSDGRQVAEIRLCAGNTATPKQWSRVRAEFNSKGEWSAKIPLPNGEYDCWVELYTIGAADDPLKWTKAVFTDTKRERVQVK